MADENWVDIGSAESCRKRRCGGSPPTNRELAVSFKDGRFGVVSNACNHVGGPLGDGRLDGDYINCPWHNWKFHRCTGKGEPGFEEDAVPAYPVKVEDGRVLVDLAAGTKRTRKPHDPHPLSRHDRARARPAADRRHLDLGDGRGQSALLRLRSSARPRAEGGSEPGRRDPADPAQRAQVPRLRGLLLEIGARLHLAVLDHADGFERPDGPRLRGAGALGRRDHRRLADPLGRCVLALFQDGRAAQLRAERRHHPQSGADPQQGRGLHHRRRPGQHPGRRRPDARLLRRAGLPLPAISLHRAFARLVARGHGAATSRSCATPRSWPKARTC